MPVRDKCPSCASTHIDLSETAFQQLAPLSTGLVRDITWKFVGSGGGDPDPDPTLPAPTGLKGTGVTDTSASLSWDPVGGATSYAVFRNGAKVGSTGSVNFTDTGLAAGTTYSYTVAAVDSSGKTGALSAAVSARTAGGGGGPGCAPAWVPSISYVPGDVVSYAGHKYTATYYSTAAVPEYPSHWAVWRDDGPCA